jgi:predicted enzyme related to lactoylglutathione lyase
VIVDDTPYLAVQLAPEHVRPQWPSSDGQQQQQIHLDLHVDDLATAHEHAVAAGATLVQPAEDPTADEGFQVYADPAGHLFCLCWE